MIIKNEIPILEYDDHSVEVITPNHDWPELQLPKKCLVAFLGDVVSKFAEEHNAEVAENFIIVSHIVKIYVFHENGEDICLVQPTIGAPAAASLVDCLISCGCEKIIAVGSCGVLADLPENVFIVPSGFEP